MNILFTVLYFANVVLCLVVGLLLIFMVDTLNSFRFVTEPLPRYLVILFGALIAYLGYWELRSFFRAKLRGKNFLFVSWVTLSFGLLVLVSMWGNRYVDKYLWAVSVFGTFLVFSGVIFLFCYYGILCKGRDDE